jgi:hypothetical protein
MTERTVHEAYERAFMDGSLDLFVYQLAENLHRTVEELLDTITAPELAQWRAFYHVRKELIELAQAERK